MLEKESQNLKTINTILVPVENHLPTLLKNDKFTNKITTWQNKIHSNSVWLLATFNTKNVTNDIFELFKLSTSPKSKIIPNPLKTDFINIFYKMYPTIAQQKKD